MATGGGGTGGGSTGRGGGIIIVPPPVGGGGGGGTTGGGSTGGGQEQDPPDTCNPADDDNTGYRRDEMGVGTWSDFTPRNITLPRGEQIAWNYDIDCDTYPNVCLNWCYYVYCKQGNSWIVTVARNAGNRGRSECASTNRCSHTCSPTGLNAGWTKNPNAQWSCDEQPKNTNAEGGIGAATRCMPRGENSGEGSKWGTFINGNGISDGTKVTVVLDNPPMGLCASYGGRGATNCPAAADPNNPLALQGFPLCTTWLGKS